MSGERCTTCDNAALSLDNAARRITELEKDRDNALSSSYVHAEMWEKAEQERDEARAQRGEARAEVERLTVICEEAGMQVGLLEREVERLRIGIERYQNKLGEYCATYRTTAGRCECAVCEWEREDKKRKESGDDAP